MIILLDQDGVLADFEHAFIDAWRARPRHRAGGRRTEVLHIREDYAPELRAKAEAIYRARLHRNLPPCPARWTQ